MTKLTSEMTKLKPCPFCGGEAELSSGKFDGKETSYVLCTKCGSRGEFFSVSPKYASAERAIEAWNRRTGDTEALRKAARKLAWIHQQIDLYDDRQELHEEDYWMDYLTDPEWIDPDIE